MATLTTKKVRELVAGVNPDYLAGYNSSTGERDHFHTPVAVVAVNRQSGEGDDGLFFVQLANDGNTPHNFVARADDLVTLSSADEVAVPTVVGLTQAAATTALTNAGLTETVTTVHTADYTAGNVFASTPGAGENVAPGSSVELYVAATPV